MYPNNLPNASIVICFYNEQFDTLARTLHSVIDRTPAHLLHEIILVDDNSDIEGLHNTIALYIKANLNGKVKLHLTKKREGLIRARIIGADLASGEVLVFLDSHVEVNKDWLQPMLQRISDNSSNVVTPIIDIINADTFQYSASPVFKWENLKPGSLRIDGDFVKPIKSPTMAGGLFAIDKNYFNAIGKYDPGMNIWGGENLEISFRIWQCGGSLEIIPCSRVGHVFRKRRPYSAPDGEDTMTRNSLRVAHVWMDEYKERYFKQRPEALRTQYGDITSRKELRSRLGCKSFSWYVQNIYPELLSNNNTVGYNPLSKDNNYIAHYQIRLSNSGLCIASEKDVKTKGSLLTLKTCLRIKNQMWSETERGEIKLAQYLCLDSGESFPKLSKCHEMGGTQEWKHKNQNASPIYNVAAGTCLSAESASVNSYINMQICTSQSNKQWDFVPLYS
ncbi:hypothetical protein AAG570_006455 [Ranatra chinensis]|uniref:Polypeptide N-acetylgalactosaminyltransferase n=1 Tax=Ranatra chinensis TaxID=642074 RepID=A0ABD0YU43_9HEMI